MPTLKRISDGAGDSGPRSEALMYGDDNKFIGVLSNRPEVGCHMLVGSIMARSYSKQDYWLTTKIIEIISETETEVIFKTKNSEYIWTA